MTETRIKLSIYLPVEKVTGIELFNHLNNKNGIVYDCLESYNEDGEEHILSFIYIEDETNISEDVAYDTINKMLDEVCEEISFQIYEVAEN